MGELKDETESVEVVSEGEKYENDDKDEKEVNAVMIEDSSENFYSYDPLMDPTPAPDLEVADAITVEEQTIENVEIKVEVIEPRVELTTL